MNRFWKYSGVLLAIVLFSGCSSSSDDDRIYDFVNPSVVFYVTDAETGEDLLDPASDKSILDQPIAVIYNEKRFEVVDGKEQHFSRATYARPFALRHELRCYGDASKGWQLAFGEFSPSTGYRDQSFALDWGDGTKTEVTLSIYINWSKGEPHIKSPIRVDGQKRDDKNDYSHWIIHISK